MTSTDTLLPCPFCGSQAAWPEPEVNMNYVQCMSCSATANHAGEWNRRTTPPPTPGTDAREAVAQWCSGCHEVRSVDCYRAGCPKSDTERRAAEILAAEASERARIVAWLDEQYCLNDDCRLDMIAAIKRNEHGAGK